MFSPQLRREREGVKSIHGRRGDVCKTYKLSVSVIYTANLPKIDYPGEI